MTARDSAGSAASPQGASSEELTAAIRGWSDDRITALLRARPDLALPAPSSMTALGTRASSGASVARAVAGLDRPTLTVAQLLAVLGPCAAAALHARAGFDTAEATTRLVALALILDRDEAIVPLDSLIQELAAEPLGLGPTLSSLGAEPADGWPVTPRDVQGALRDAPPAARRVLDAMMWGPAIGTFTDLPDPVQWLIDSRLLLRTSPAQVVLPREVALALRGEVVAPSMELAAPLAPSPARAAETVAAESTRAGEAMLTDLAALVRSWSAHPPAVLRGGGLGVRDLRELATTLQCSTERAALIVELAAASGLVGKHDGDHGTVWAPTHHAAAQLREPLAQQWEQLASQWLDSTRASWLVGTRTEKGTVRAALDPDLNRSWAAVLRRRVLHALAAWPAGTAPDDDAVTNHLEWDSPKSAPPAATVSAILSEAAHLGITGAGALSAAGRALISPDGAAADAFLADLPAALGEVFIQGDLTGVVPGRPEPELADLLQDVADVESRGSAMAVRFTADSIGRALDAGWQAEAILAELTRVSATPVPQALEYLIGDAARIHGRLRVGRASAFVRAQDEAAAAAVVADPSLASLGLRAIAPTVLICRVGADELATLLRRSGHPVLIEGADGTLSAPGDTPIRAGAPLPQPATSRSVTDNPDALAALIARLRSREAATGDGSEPAHLLQKLQAASAHDREITLTVAAADGATQRHRVRALGIAGGRARVVDLRSETEITVAVHRIIDVELH